MPCYPAAAGERRPWLPKRYAFFLGMGLALDDSPSAASEKVTCCTVALWLASHFFLVAVASLLPACQDAMGSEHTFALAASHVAGLAMVIFGLWHYCTAGTVALLRAGLAISPLLAGGVCCYFLNGQGVAHLQVWLSPVITTCTGNRATSTVLAATAAMAVATLAFGIEEDNSLVTAHAAADDWPLAARVAAWCYFNAVAFAGSALLVRYFLVPSERVQPPATVAEIREHCATEESYRRTMKQQRARGSPARRKRHAHAAADEEEEAAEESDDKPAAFFCFGFSLQRGLSYLVFVVFIIVGLAGCCVMNGVFERKRDLFDEEIGGREEQLAEVMHYAAHSKLLMLTRALRGYVHMIGDVGGRDRYIPPRMFPGNHSFSIHDAAALTGSGIAINVTNAMTGDKLTVIAEFVYSTPNDVPTFSTRSQLGTVSGGSSGPLHLDVYRNCTEVQVTASFNYSDFVFLSWSTLLYSRRKPYYTQVFAAVCKGQDGYVYAVQAATPIFAPDEIYEARGQRFSFAEGGRSSSRGLDDMTVRTIPLNNVRGDTMVMAFPLPIEDESKRLPMILLGLVIALGGISSALIVHIGLIPLRNFVLTAHMFASGGRPLDEYQLPADRLQELLYLKWSFYRMANALVLARCYMQPDGSGYDALMPTEEHSEDLGHRFEAAKTTGSSELDWRLRENGNGGFARGNPLEDLGPQARSSPPAAAAAAAAGRTPHVSSLVADDRRRGSAPGTPAAVDGQQGAVPRSPSLLGRVRDTIMKKHSVPPSPKGTGDSGAAASGTPGPTPLSPSAGASKAAQSLKLLQPSKRKAVRFIIEPKRYLRDHDAAVACICLANLTTTLRKDSVKAVKLFCDTFSTAFSLVQKFKGTVGQVQGDRMFSIWKDPSTACTLAVRTIELLAEKAIPATVQVGVSGGRVMYGKFCLEKQTEGSTLVNLFNIVGAPVSKAIALQKLATELDTKILIDTWVLNQLNKAADPCPAVYVPAEIITYRSMLRPVKGPPAQVIVYEILGLTSEYSEATQPTPRHPEAALGNYYPGGPASVAHRAAAEAVVEGNLPKAVELLKGTHVPVNRHVAHLFKICKEDRGPREVLID